MHGSGKLPWGRGLCTMCDQCLAASSLGHPITGWTLTRLTDAGQSSFCSLAATVSHVARELWLQRCSGFYSSDPNTAMHTWICETELLALHRSDVIVAAEMQQKQGESTNRSEFCRLWGTDKLLFWSHYVLKQLIGRLLLCGIRHIMINCLRNADCWKVSPLSGTWCEFCCVNTGADHVEPRKAYR